MEIVKWKFIYSTFIPKDLSNQEKKQKMQL
jgi:hypothetical protein